MEKKSGSASTTGSGSSTKQVFGIPLTECIQNDTSKAFSSGGDLSKSLDLHEHRQLRSSSGSRPSLTGSDSAAPKASCDSLSVERRTIMRAASDECGKRYQSSDNLPAPENNTPRCRHSLTPNSSPRPSFELTDEPDGETRVPVVPRILETCTDYLKRNGLTTVGLFRVAGSAKRCRHMRLEVDSGREILFGEEEEGPAAHDIATLLKEYLRDLPEPLLTRELYAGFVAAGGPGIASLADRILALQCLVALLPPANVDTLLVLLHFLQDVAAHAHDILDDGGVRMVGNKMTSGNLATIFAPSLLWSTKTSAQEHTETIPTVHLLITAVEDIFTGLPQMVGNKMTSGNLATIFAPSLLWSTKTSAQEHTETIPTVHLLITAVEDIFTIAPEMVHKMLLSLADSDVDAVDAFLDRLQRNCQDKEQPPEELATTVFYTSQEKEFPQESEREGDEFVLRTKNVQTHRIVYKVERGRVIGSAQAIPRGQSLEEPNSQPDENSPAKSAPASFRTSRGEEPFPELKLFIDDDAVTPEEPLPLIDPNRRTHSNNPFARLIRPSH